MLFLLDFDSRHFFSIVLLMRKTFPELEFLFLTSFICIAIQNREQVKHFKWEGLIFLIVQRRKAMKFFYWKGKKGILPFIKVFRNRTVLLDDFLHFPFAVNYQIILFLIENYMRLTDFKDFYNDYKKSRQSRTGSK